MRRNDVVYDKNDDSPFYIYGRVWKFLPNGKVAWLTCKLEYYESDPEDLIVVSGYTGRWDFTSDGMLHYYHKLKGGGGRPDYSRKKYSRPVRFVYMPSLKNLKRRYKKFQNWLNTRMEKDA